MKPPGKPFNKYQRRISHAFKQRLNHAAEEETIKQSIVIYPTSSQNLIRCIHSQDGDHKNDFYYQDQIGVQRRPTFHLRFCEPVYLHHISTHKKSHTGHQNRNSQEFKDIHCHTISCSQKWGKNPMGSCNTVDDKFKHFKIDDDKGYINQ